MASFETYESEDLTGACDTAVEAYYTSEPDVVWVGPPPTWMPPWRSPRRVNALASTFCGLVASAKALRSRPIESLRG